MLAAIMISCPCSWNKSSQQFGTWISRKIVSRLSGSA
ncbi:hypothetical protein FOMG_19451 [Fusarium oxysporum f. sp. melonis 26406]|uniref:Uncharacterized protein n=1 Tax=Fusarium oxysporum f. sp. melonis 26406 TaxID=1089452 RepID=W9ZRN9_FUSOX|nr:hypothetical protein FOMG_19451 [Fusarium oxysporum f. sp. melonis 26406]